MSEKQDKLKRALGMESGNANADLTKVTGQMDYSYLFAVLEQLPLETMNQLDICKAIFERITMKFLDEFYEERNLRIKYEKTIIRLTGVVDAQERELLRVRALLPAESKEEAMQTPAELALHQRGASAQGLA